MDTIQTILEILLTVSLFVLLFWVAWRAIKKVRKMPAIKVIGVVLFLILVPALTYAVLAGSVWYSNWSEAYEIEQQSVTQCVGKVILDTGLNERFIEVNDIEKVDIYVILIDGSIPGHSWHCFPDVAGQPVVLYDPLLPRDQ